MIKAPKPGQVAPRFDKRTEDELVFEIDCSELLPDNLNRFFGKAKVTEPIGSPISITKSKIRQGKYLTFVVEGGPTDVPYSDYSIHFTINCTNGSKITVPVVLRCYST
jgi:hypothetical protein